LILRVANERADLFVRATSGLFGPAIRKTVGKVRDVSKLASFFTFGGSLESVAENFGKSFERAKLNVFKL
jgi:hypothetical protein